MNELAEVLALAKDATVSGLALLGVVSFVRGWVVTKPHHDEVKAIYEARIAIQSEIIRQLRNGGDKFTPYSRSD